MELQVQPANLWLSGDKGMEGQTGRLRLTCIHYYKLK